MSRILFFLCLLSTLSLHAQQLDHALIDELKYHVNYLADDSLEGRATASKGEKMASDYLSRMFKESGLSPYQGVSYLQPFNYIEGRLVGKNTALTINGNALTLDKDFYPLAYSASGKAKGNCMNVGFGISAPELKYDDYRKKINYAGNIFLLNISTPSGTNPHGAFGNYLELRPRIEKAIAMGATAVLLYAEEDSITAPEQLLNKNIYPVSVPVLFLKTPIWHELKPAKTFTAALTAEVTPIEKTGNNVVAWMDNKATTTVLLGAHYDHLGWGHEGSLYRGEKAIHNGADDNASGVALIVELAEELKKSSLKNNNYLFVAFSGEEMGLFGSKKFVEQIGADAKKINYMLNYDMVGRLNPNEKNLQVNGFGTSPAWNVLKQIPTDSIRIKTSDSGIGPSDHTSFYLKDIPVLHFFTGAHEDYHKPSDDAEFVNYAGIASILNLSYALIDSLDDAGKIQFTTVAADTNQPAPKFTVTLGVIPDYMFSDGGMRIDGVTDGKPASKAGMKKGDVVIQMGAHKVSDMTTYMQALSKLKKGDTATVIALREGKEMEFTVVF